VLPILFNHVGVRGFGGGYVGVDIFFVISGFLITGILQRDLKAGRHSIIAFYKRRALRILPALCAMVLAVTVSIPFVALPGEISRYASSLIATGLFATNFLFYSESGYFDAASHAKPLLHLWSLAIEEQFYLLWPLLLSALCRRSQTTLFAMLGLTIALSFSIAVWLVRIDMTAAFYLLPSRIWELAIGGLLACLPRGRRSRWSAETAALAAVLALLYCIWHYSSLTPFPGIGALLPCIATGVLIATGPETLIGRCLSLAPLRLCGLISYSLYLWHWPVIVIGELGLLLPPTPAVMLGEIALSILLAFLSWHFIERPFRKAGQVWPSGRILTASVSALALIIVTGGVLRATSDLANRFTPTQTIIGQYAGLDLEPSYRRGTCFLAGPYDTLDPACVRTTGKRPSILIVGDSEAAHLWPGLSRYRDRYDVLQATVVGCRPGIYSAHSDGQCERFYREILQRWVPAHKPSLLILAGRWQTMDPPFLEPELEALQSTGIPTLLVGPLPDYSISLPRLLVFADRRHDPALPDRWMSQQPFLMDSILRDMTARHQIGYVSLLQKLCRSRSCRHFAALGVPLQFDTSHLTPAGSDLIAQMLEPEIAASLARQVSTP
jgi:peptidoglycan/LPS O-acetylase OafA/YrhL